MLEWDTFQDYGLAVWCDKTLVLGALRALNGNLNGAPMLLDAIGLVDAIVWFDRVIVDGTLRAEWLVQIAGAITPRHLSLRERSDLRAALEETWDGPRVSPHCENFWRRLFADPAFTLDLSDADFEVDSARTADEFMRSVEMADWTDELGGYPATPDGRAHTAAFSTVQALAGGLISADRR